MAGATRSRCPFWVSDCVCVCVAGADTDTYVSLRYTTIGRVVSSIMHFNPKTLLRFCWGTTRVVCHKSSKKRDKKEQGEGRRFKKQPLQKYKNFELKTELNWTERLCCRFLFHFWLTFSFRSPLPLSLLILSSCCSSYCWCCCCSLKRRQMFFLRVVRLVIIVACCFNGFPSPLHFTPHSLVYCPLLVSVYACNFVVLFANGICHKPLERATDKNTEEEE